MKMSTTKCPKWSQLLQQSHKKNSKCVVFVQMANLRRNGQPSLHNLRFLDFLEDDPKYLLFLMSFNDNNLHGDIKSCPTVQLNWHMQATQEIYNLSGRFYITSSPKKITRFPAPKIILDETSPREYWESIRSQYWNSLSPRTRAIFTWPPSGEIPKSDKDAFKCLKLDSMLDELNDYSGLNNNNNNNNNNNSPGKVLHDLAFENFCILVFKVGEVKRFEYGIFPSKKMVYTFDDDEDAWIEEESNP
ncbi:hypothetical protein Glove_253g75 [Diversispora epigaea]|uniref:Pyridoxamine 5'-phosphate oxidase Alr4036 family FMN-binding domain-containing protein n=1 Tax=Diversispora epigaea TaxID=1348612 RepID=A0A397I831_9GLOM|nr:hypothetical protein Glove_253g75 [Diversispora epigaea]